MVLIFLLPLFIVSEWVQQQCNTCSRMDSSVFKRFNFTCVLLRSFFLQPLIFFGRIYYHSAKIIIFDETFCNSRRESGSSDFGQNVRLGPTPTPGSNFDSDSAASLMHTARIFTSHRLVDVNTILKSMHALTARWYVPLLLTYYSFGAGAAFATARAVTAHPISPSAGSVDRRPVPQTAGPVVQCPCGAPPSQPCRGRLARDYRVARAERSGTGR